MVDTKQLAGKDISLLGFHDPDGNFMSDPWNKAYIYSELPEEVYPGGAVYGCKDKDSSKPA